VNDLVFVYGTLRKDVRGPLQAALTRGWESLGCGAVAADLYDLGAYPGAVPRAAAGPRVRGELYRIPNVTATLARLDDHEGEEFTRALVDVSLESGKTERAWIYWYRSEPRGRRLASGDYVIEGVPRDGDVR
jgi:gamma-glutamylcyclotransferase (GGCT)/AIG2-like uncharacterized protein YtfP